MYVYIYEYMYKYMYRDRYSNTNIAKTNIYILSSICTSINVLAGGRCYLYRILIARAVGNPSQAQRRLADLALL